MGLVDTILSDREEPYPCARLPPDDRWRLWCDMVPGSMAKINGGPWMHPDDFQRKHRDEMSFIDSVIVGVVLRRQLPTAFIVGGNMPPSVAVELSQPVTD